MVHLTAREKMEKEIEQNISEMLSNDTARYRNYRVGKHNLGEFEHLEDIVTSTEE